MGKFAMQRLMFESQCLFLRLVGLIRLARLQPCAHIRIVQRLTSEAERLGLFDGFRGRGYIPLLQGFQGLVNQV
jgi:hypothetical protein